jgi:RNA polymerase sigma-70 factor (ECF subfamily)
MRADLVGQSMGTEPTYEGKEAVAARFNGTRGATPVIIDGELGAAWFQAGSTKVAFVFHLDEARLVSEVELIAAPDVLATMDIERVRRSSSR